MLTSTLTKSAINEMADYFAVEVDEPVHLHSLMGTIAPTLKDSLGDLTTLLSIASAGKTQPSDYNCTLNRENPSKAFKCDNPVLNVYRRDRNKFHRTDRALVIVLSYGS